LDGRDYWQPITDLKYHDREIVLNCYIKANSEAQFKSRLNAFFAALKAEGKRTLAPPYGDPVECYLDKHVLIERKTKYVTNYQIGVFVLRFTVPGDPAAIEVTIKRWTGEQNIDVTTVFSSNLRVQKALQGDIYSTISFESPEKLELKYFDYIEVNSNGNNKDIFHLASEPNYRKQSTNKYIYDLRLEHQGTWLGNSQFLNLNNESDFFIHANLEEIIEIIIVNHNRSWWNNFHKGSIESTERRLHKFSGEDCLSVLRRLCAEYKLEYEFKYIQAGKYYINVAEQVANDREVTLEYGKGMGLYELSREPFDKNDLCTILYAFGSNKNLKPGYRGGLGRLSFDNNPLSNNQGLHDGAGPHERTVFFDDIFPQRTAEVTAYEQKLTKSLTPAEKYRHPNGIYKLTDSSLNFNLNDYLLGGLFAKVRMKTGNLAGYEFEIQMYDHDTKEMFLIPFKDERGDMFPNSLLTITSGDEYTLVDIDQPESYVAIAEAELESAAEAYLANYSIPKFPYRCIVDPAYMIENPGGFEVGDRVTIVDEDYGIDGLFRISNLTYDVYRKTYEFVLSDVARLTRRQQMEMRIDTIERAQEAMRKDQPENTRKDVETTNELRNRILHPNGDFIKCDPLFRNESIDPRMLAYDTGVPQFYLSDSLIETNIDNDEDKVRIEGGTISISNWEGGTLSRFEISKMRQAGMEYNPTRTWIVKPTTLTLPTKEGYWIYAKCNLRADPGEGDGWSKETVIVAYPEHLEVKLEIEDQWLFYKWGHISKGGA